MIKDFLDKNYGPEVSGKLKTTFEVNVTKCDGNSCTMHVLEGLKIELIPFETYDGHKGYTVFFNPMNLYLFMELTDSDGKLHERELVEKQFKEDLQDTILSGRLMWFVDDAVEQLA